MSVTQAVNQTSIPTNHNLRFIGLRMKENGNRVFSLRKYGEIHQYKNDGSYRSCPLINWSWLDVWAYIVANDLPYLKIYDNPNMGGKRVSRTSSVVSHRLLEENPKHGGVNHGRIGKYKSCSPKFYNLLIQKAPHLEIKT